ncbi:hypothetical protein QYE76_013239 [Lolium multiflorum]|uniref:Uncharacterized protein n=1 Tax=Lolium multiflorum TaxID=4521 RepID=A0AAD8X718_LOLMU|nr:hypothetical protein QYE76_013239 [Lolium multiflorum]
MPYPCRPPSLTLSLATILTPLLVLEHLYPSSTSTVHAPATLDHAIGRNARAQTRQKTCQARGDRALACLWTRQSTPSCHRLRPPLSPYFCNEHHRTTSYTLDMLAGTRERPSHRHDQHLCRHEALSAFTLHTKSVPLLLLDLPDLCSTLIKPYTAPIASSESPESAAEPPFDLGHPKLRHCTRGLYTLDNLASTISLDRRRPSAPSDPLPRRRSRLSSPVDDDDARPSIVHLIRRPTSPGTDSMEPYVQTETYDLENGGSLVFERDLYLVSEKLERPPPRFHGVRIHNTPAGEQQWMITVDLKGSSEPPISERILFSFKAQLGGRSCSRSSEGLARKDLELTRVHAHRAQMALAHHADAIRLLAKDRRSLRLQRAKNVATITRLREKIRTLEVTVRTQQDQIQEMEEDGEDIQGGDDFLSDDNDFEDDEFTDEEDYEFLEAAEDGIIPIDVDEDNEE